MAEFFINNNTADSEFDIFPMSQFMNWDEDTYDVLGSSFLKRMNREVEQSGEARILECECRFDVISHKYTKQQNYWWFFMEYNDKIDWDIRSEEHIKIPNLSSIFFLRSDMILSNNKRRKGN